MRILLGLGLYLGQRDADLLRLDHPAGPLVHVEQVVGEAVPLREGSLPDSDATPGVQAGSLGVLDDPARRDERLVDGLAGQLFGCRWQTAFRFLFPPAFRDFG